MSYNRSTSIQYSTYNSGFKIEHENIGIQTENLPSENTWIRFRTSSSEAIHNNSAYETVYSRFQTGSIPIIGSDISALQNRSFLTSGGSDPGSNPNRDPFPAPISVSVFPLLVMAFIYFIFLHKKRRKMTSTK